MSDSYRSLLTGTAATCDIIQSMKYYVIGDTGGHLPQLMSGLEHVGVDTENKIIPEDVTVIHLGDLIHKGPSTSLKALNFVRAMQQNNPGRWVQLIGNHEIQHISGGLKFWKCNCGEDFEVLLNSMFVAGEVVFSYYVEDMRSENLTLSKRTTFVPENRDWLFTHGGLTRLWWGKVHNSNPDVRTLSESINSLPADIASSPGVRLGYPRNPASPVWASAPTEVFPGWFERGSMPFNQVVGHTYLFNWEKGRWYGRPERTLKSLTKLNETIRASLTLIGDSVLVVADPGFESAEPTVKSQPVILLGAK